jgi:beta-lactamase regulating signal transducer with metallopeptidase domain
VEGFLLATAAWLARTAAGGGLLLLLAWGLMGLVRQPVRRQRLGEWGLAAALVVAALSLAPGWLVVPLPWPAASPAAAPVDVPAPTAPHAAGPLALPGAEVWADPFLVPGDAVVSPSPGAAEPSPAASPVHPSVAVLTWSRLAEALAAAYLVIAAGLLGRWLLGHVALWRLLAAARPAPAPLLRLLAEAAGGRPPRLLVSDRVRVPLSCGLLRPTVVLPAGMEDGPALRWVFAHELAHLRRRDALSCVLFGLGQAVFFYLPWFWRVRSHVRLCQEYVADAAAGTAGPVDYAEFLVSLAGLPAVPAGAAGVTGRPTDLFRRVTMLLKSAAPVEPRCPRRWAWAVGAGLLSLAVLVSVVTLRGHAAPVPEPVKADGPKKDEPKKEEPKKDDKKDVENPFEVPGIVFPDIDDFLKKFPADMPAEQREQLKKQLEMVRERMKAAGRLQGGVGGLGGNPFGGATRPDEGRLGVLTEKPGATLVEQLDLPRDQGLVLAEVKADSAAAKAGLKAHDILLEWAGKPVPSDAREFKKMVDEVKANAPVDVVVLRKGRKETIKGVALPEAKPEKPALPGFQFPNLPNFPAGLPGAALGGNGGLTAVFRNGDQFTARL